MVAEYGALVALDRMARDVGFPPRAHVGERMVEWTKLGRVQ